MMKQTIYFCSKLANEAYSDKLKTIQNSTLLINQNTDCEVHVGLHNNIIYVACRGTSSLKDAIHDIQLWRTKCKFLKNTCVHSGFLQQYISIQCNVQEEIRNILNNEKKIKSIVFTGHSLGGALSTIAALDFKLKNPKIIVKCITFASPRVGCPKFAKLFNANVDISHRLVYHRDPVTFAPFCLRFRHVKGCIHFKKDNSVDINENYFFPIGCFVTQHLMDKYKERVEEWNDEIFMD